MLKRGTTVVRVMPETFEEKTRRVVRLHHVCPGEPANGFTAEGLPWVVFVDLRTGIAYSGVFGSMHHDVSSHTHREYWEERL